MTSIAVTASMCASAAEVALLVASFMPVLSLDLGATSRGAATRNGRQNFTRNTPHTSSSRPNDVPMRQRRLCQRRTVLRRQFDSGMARGGYCFGKIRVQHDREHQGKSMARIE